VTPPAFLARSAALTAAIDSLTPLLAEVRRAAPANDVDRVHPFPEVRRLAEAGLGGARVPVELGGHGLELAEFFDLLITLGAADSNLPQALRQHFFRVELILLGEQSAERDELLRQVAAGTIYGNATSEVSDVPIGTMNTVLRPHDDGSFRLNGKKFYSTGNLYAQFIPVAAVDDNGDSVVAIVPAGRPGVSIADDWMGFGQRLTASGTTTFTDVVVEESEIQRYGAPDSHHGMGFHQLILLATLAGIARAAADDVRDFVRDRNRVYSAGSGDLPRHDPIIQEAVGRAESAAFTARAIVLAAAAELQVAWDSWNSPDAGATSAAFADADITVSAAQVAIVPLVLDQTSHIFDALGASSTHSRAALDRHWRNARTVGSHNPWIYKARQVGDYVLNDVLPPIFVAGSDVGVHPGTRPQA
jgi:alkylation response protein AidB-like acyl-CoA dehydrogenase